jgi:hypothetical protein
MRDFYIVKRDADHPQGADWKQIGSGREVVDFVIDHQTCGEPHEQINALKDLVGALLERAAVSDRDLMDLAGLQAYRIERY